MTRKLKEIIIKRIFFLFACVSILILGLIVTFLFREGLPIFRIVSVRDFLLGSEWYPTFDPPCLRHLAADRGVLHRDLLLHADRRAPGGALRRLHLGDRAHDRSKRS